MATNKNSFILYCDLIHTVSKLNDEQAGKLFKHILSYVNDENPVTEDLITNLAFEPVKQALKRDLVKYEKLCEKNKENIRKRWDTKKNEKIPNDTTVYERIRTDTKNTDNDNDSDSDINIIADEFLNEVKSGQHKMMIEGWKMNLKIDGFALQKLLTEFRTHLITDNIKHSNTLQFRKHFKNWLNALDAKGKLNEYKTQRIGSL